MRNLTIVATIITIVLTGLVIEATGQQPQQVIPPHIVSVTHLHWSITAWSDGTIDVGVPMEMTASSARRLSVRLGDIEDERRMIQRERRRAQLQQQQPRVQLVPALDPSDTQCNAIATSTGNRCRNNVPTDASGTPKARFCHVHKGQSKAN